MAKKHAEKDKNIALMRQMSRWHKTREINRQSKDNQREKDMLGKMVGYFNDIIDHGTLQQKVDTLQLMQTLDYQYLTDDQKDRNHIAENIESMATGLKHYEICRDSPKQYREFSEGFRKQERVAPGREVPDDGMHKALRSHIKHIETRMSPMMQPQENAFITAQRNLALSIRNDYISLQKSVLCLDAEKKRSSDQVKSIASDMMNAFNKSAGGKQAEQSRDRKSPEQGTDRANSSLGHG